MNTSGFQRAIVGFRRSIRVPPHLTAFLVAVVVSAVVIGVTFFFGGVLGGFLGFVLVSGLGLWAAGILIFHIYELVRQRDSQKAKSLLGALLTLCLSPVCFFAVMWLSIPILTWGTFAVEYHRYERTIALIDRGQLPPDGKTGFQTAADGTVYEADRQSPHRVAFLLPGGFLNNWNGILYDPDGVGKRAGVRQKDGTIADLLDDWWTIEHCSKLIGHFYSCSFS